MDLERLDKAMNWIEDACVAIHAASVIGERVTWCETHFDTWTTAGCCRNGLAENEAHRCSKVSKLLIDPPTEEEA